MTSPFNASDLALMDEFRAQCSDRCFDIDPGGKVHWPDLAFGWFLAKGKTPTGAWELVDELIRKGHL